jgi:hypothetical protein
MLAIYSIDFNVTVTVIDRSFVSWTIAEFSNTVLVNCYLTNG